MKLSWNWLKDYVAISKPPSVVCERLTMAGLEVKKIEKIEDDFLIETEITSNRADWLSHIGVAREIAACYGLDLKIPQIKINPIKSISAPVTVKTEDPSLCPYYSGVIVENVALVKTPQWMKKRLELCGIRSINFIVDVTNYVLLETGQPLHAFDLDKLSGRQVSARCAKKKEPITAIDGKIYELEPGDCVIADAKGPVAIGGVMGGKESEVSEKTRNLFIESAFFTPSAIRRTARKLKLGSESSYRFERRVDPSGVDYARDRAVQLMIRHSNQCAVSRVFHSGKISKQSTSVSLSVDNLARILGQSIPVIRAKKILVYLGFSVGVRKKQIKCQIPTFRPDVTAEADLIEEIARIDGYDRIPEKLPMIQPLDPASDPLIDLSDEARHICVGLGLREIVNFSVINPDALEKVDSSCKEGWVLITNPRNQQLTLMRPTFLLNFLEVIAHNLNAGIKSIAVFEIGNRYWNQKKDLPIEEKSIAIGLAGDAPANWLESKHSYGFHHLKGMVSSFLGRFNNSFELAKIQGHPFYEAGKAMSVVIDNETIGNFGVVKSEICKRFDINGTVCFGELSLRHVAGLEKVCPHYKEIPRFPEIERDLALIVDERVHSEDLIKRIKTFHNEWIRDIDVFDVYRGGKIPAGKKSIAYRIHYQSHERTLETNEVNSLHFKIVDTLSRDFSAELPSKA